MISGGAAMFDFQFFKPILQFVFVVALLIAEGYGLFRLAVAILMMNSSVLRTLLLILLLPLCFLLIYIDFIVFYFLGGGH
jgi:hypothetical protein